LNGVGHYTHEKRGLVSFTRGKKEDAKGVLAKFRLPKLKPSKGF